MTLGEKIEKLARFSAAHPQNLFLAISPPQGPGGLWIVAIGINTASGMGTSLEDCIDDALKYLKVE